MLVLSRDIGQFIDIDGGRISVVVVHIRGDKVWLGVEAPREVTVHRREVQRAIEYEQAVIDGVIEQEQRDG